jgi:hypothetical protein
MESNLLRPVSRRTFLKVCGGVGLAIGAIGLLPAGLSEAASGEWKHTGPFPKKSTYKSGTFLASFSFNSVALSWKAKEPAETNVTFQGRTSPDGANWTPWVPIEADVDGKDYDPEHAYGRLLVVSPSTRFQFWATLASGGATLADVLREVDVAYFNTAAGPKQGQFLTGPTLDGAPGIISRAGWGADESYRYYNGKEIWPADYQSVTKIVIHHTATRNDEADPAATVRGIYRYHAVSRGWGDIGYNFLVDRNGNIYEGRAGGEDVIGGHVGDYNPGTCGIALVGDYTSTAISAGAQEALAKLLAWKCGRKGISPTGASNFDDLTNLPNVAGHRDLMATSCPGDSLYKVLPAIRNLAAGKDPGEIAGDPAVQIVSVNFSPLTVIAGEKLKVEVQVKSTGTGSVPTQDPNPGLTYGEADTFKTLGYQKINDKFRVAVDYSGNQGISHPYRWGLGDPLKPGNIATITGYVKLTSPGVRQYWAGTIEEYVKYWEDNQGTVNVSVVNNPVAGVDPRDDPGLRYFSETRHHIGGGFRMYWEGSGDLMMFGYPLTEEYTEVSSTDGQPYTTQYFERARFEYHPENKGTPYEVLLGLLGCESTVGRDFPKCKPFESGSDNRYFSETQHSLSFSFLKYWDNHGGLPVFGYPISEELTETSPTDGKQYTVQYFERNRFEYHPENMGTEYEVLLGHLGREALMSRGWLS